MSEEIHTYVYEVKMVARVTVRAGDAGRAEAIVGRAVKLIEIGPVTFRTADDHDDQFEVLIDDYDPGSRPFLAEYDGEPTQ
jgi:hypothetical protein